MTSENIFSALIAGIVSLIVAIIVSSVKIRGFKEVQIQEILKARIKAYSKLWSILIRYGNINFYHNLKYDKNWVINYHDELDKCNMKYGVLFSKNVHDNFEKLREGLKCIKSEIEMKEEYIGSSEFQKACKELYNIIDDKDNKRKGLGGLLKKDLGSFQGYSLSKTKIK